jgi:hypothetical protein
VNVLITVHSSIIILFFFLLQIANALVMVPGEIRVPEGILNMMIAEG